ncbi:Uncharacterised protein [[Clostridium] sordellii]|nr:Uncharacterised protein [[Clostridium] sordellii] [Paeniclostridium sordellii]CEN30356.1 Uncharacterised protein [[Clostridium] sordellii] [Paeniclostridium sordellii]
MKKDELIEIGEKLQLIFENSQEDFYYISGYIDAKKED